MARWPTRSTERLKKTKETIEILRMKKTRQREKGRTDQKFQWWIKRRGVKMGKIEIGNWISCRIMCGVAWRVFLCCCCCYLCICVREVNLLIQWHVSQQIINIILILYSSVNVLAIEPVATNSIHPKQCVEFCEWWRWYWWFFTFNHFTESDCSPQLLSNVWKKAKKELNTIQPVKTWHARDRIHRLWSTGININEPRGRKVEACSKLNHPVSETVFSSSFFKIQRVGFILKWTLFSFDFSILWYRICGFFQQIFPWFFRYDLIQEEKEAWKEERERYTRTLISINFFLDYCLSSHRLPTSQMFI